MKIPVLAAEGRCVFNDHEVNSGLKHKRKLKPFLQKLLKHYRKKPAFIEYTFLNDESLIEINRQYLGHDTYTDIITFELSKQGDDHLIADIYISSERVRENAGLAGVPYQEELLRVILHGALHLCGYKDKTITQQAEMRTAEEKYLRRFLRLV